MLNSRLIFIAAQALALCAVLPAAPGTAALAQVPAAAAASDAAQTSQDIAVVAGYGSEEHLLALWRLGAGGRLTGEELHALRGVLWEDDWRVRWLALRAIASNCTEPLPPEDHSAPEPAELRELRQINELLPGRLSDSAPEVRALAARCMLALGPGSSWPRSGNYDYGDLVVALSDPYMEVSEPLKQVLAQWITTSQGWDRERVVYDMLRALAEERYFSAVRLLENKPDESFTPAVMELEQESARRVVRSDAILDVFRLTAEQTLPVLAAIAGDRDSPERLPAVEALGALGAQAAPAVPQLAQALFDGDLELARSAFDALESIGPAAVKATPQLIQLVETDRAYLRSQATWRLGFFAGAAGPDAVLALLKRAGDQSHGGQALEAIKAIAPDVYDAYAPLAQAAAYPRTYNTDEAAAQQAWAKVLNSHTLRSKVTRLWRRNPGKSAWLAVDQNSSPQELASFFADLSEHPNRYVTELSTYLPGWETLPEEALPALWKAYRDKQLSSGWESQPAARQPELPVIARALAKHDPQAYDKFHLLASDADVNQRRLGLYGLACCGATTSDLAPEMMQRLRAPELTPYERALCARVLATSGTAGQYAAELLALLEAAFRDGYEISATEIVKYGFDRYHWSLDEGAGMLGQTYDMLAAALTEALCGCGPGAAPMLLAKVREKHAAGSSDSSMYEEQRVITARTRRSAMLALGRSGVELAPLREALYPGAPLLLPDEVDVTLQWLQVGRPLRYFSHDPQRLQEELRDRAAAAETLGRLGCIDERVLRALFFALQDEVTAPPPAEIDPNDWRAKLLPPEMPLRGAAVQALERLATSPVLPPAV